MFSRFVDLLSREKSMPSAGLKRNLLFSLLFFSFVFKLIFIFQHSNYTGHLVSDMWLYWQRAHERFQGHYFGVDQWYANPPFFPIFLEQFFKVLAFLRLSQHELPLVLIFFTVLSTLSVFWVYGIAAKLTGGFWRALGAAVLYAFCYPILYFNTFVLTENLATPLFIFVLWIIFKRETSMGWVAAAGLLFGAAVAIRVALGPIGFFICLYLWAAQPISWKRFFRAAAFSSTFFIVIFFLLVENFFISKGQLTGLAGYFGFNVFLQYCKVRNAYSGSAFYNNPTFMAHHPEFSVFHTNHPFNDKAYFLDLVQNCIQNNPHIWVENLRLFKDVFLYPPWPSFANVAGYSFWMPVFCYGMFFLCLSIGLFYWVAPRQRLWLSRITLLLSPIFCSLVMCYFFGIEGRYLVPCLFGIYIVFFAVLPYALQQRKKMDVYYASLLLLFSVFLTGFQIEKMHLQNKYGVSSIQKTDLAKMSRRVSDETPGDQFGLMIIPNTQSGVLLGLERPREAQILEISTDSMDDYRVEFYLEGKKKGELMVTASERSRSGTHARTLSMPEPMLGKFFNQILVRPVQGDGFYSLAYLILDPIEPERVQKAYGVTALQEIALSQVSRRVPDGSPGDQLNFIVMPDTQSGVLLLNGVPRTARKIEISTDSYDTYEIEFYLKDEKQGQLLLPLAQPAAGGIYKRILNLPKKMKGREFDRILVRPINGDGFFSLAYLILDPS